eukprot:GCRY01002742.1.p1 GENE.GCRY01002742.1~~GCRY01002742.1.p1  ORF type:complete len:234 (+),score=50.52 GCRY01002742.1:299-1000(+)
MDKTAASSTLQKKYELLRAAKAKKAAQRGKIKPQTKKLELDSILNSLSAPPSQVFSTRRRLQNEAQKNEIELRKKAEKERHTAYSKYIYGILDKFISSPEKQLTINYPEEKALNFLINECVDCRGLVSHTIESKEKKEIYVFKAECAPSSEELKKLQDPEGYLELEKIKQIQTEELKRMEEDRLRSQPPRRKRKAVAGAPVPVAGELVALNTQKRDKRSVEEVQVAMRARGLS